MLVNCVGERCVAVGGESVMCPSAARRARAAGKLQKYDETREPGNPLFGSVLVLLLQRRLFPPQTKDRRMMFDPVVLYHALYVAFVYSLLAFGATFYRKVIDELEVRQVRLGEDMFFAYDPMNAILLAGFFAALLLFTAIALFVVQPEVLFYVIPLALMINIIQIAWRAHSQRMIVRTLGVVGRSVFADKYRAVPYAAMQMVEIKDKGVWSELVVWYLPDDSRPHTVATFRFRLRHGSAATLLRFIRNRSDAVIHGTPKSQ